MTGDLSFTVCPVEIDTGLLTFPYDVIFVLFLRHFLLISAAKVQFLCDSVSPFPSLICFRANFAWKKGSE